MKWFTSDLHFAHPFVAALRGYALPGYARDESIKQQAEHDGRQLKDCVDWRRHDADIIQTINTYAHPSLISVMPTLPTSPNTLANFSSVRLELCISWLPRIKCLRLRGTCRFWMRIIA